jgi:hypothetical protein
LGELVRHLAGFHAGDSQPPAERNDQKSRVDAPEPEYHPFEELLDFLGVPLQRTGAGHEQRKHLSLEGGSVVRCAAGLHHAEHPIQKQLHLAWKRPIKKRRGEDDCVSGEHLAEDSVAIVVLLSAVKSAARLLARVALNAPLNMVIHKSYSFKIVTAVSQRLFQPCQDYSRVSLLSGASKKG